MTDRLEYLASAYYGDYKKDSLIRRDNGIYETYVNSGELVGLNILVINPKNRIKQEITRNNTKTNQHLGIIDQIQRTASTNPVSLTMGNNFYENEDLSIDGYMPLTLTRSYNSMGESFHEFGMNWSDSYTYFLQDLGNTIAIRFEDGHIEYYPKKSDGTFDKPEGLARKLKKNSSGTYTLTVDGVERYEFTANGKISKIKDLNDNTTTFTYTDGLITKIENMSGAFVFTYNTDGTIKSVKDSGNRVIKYGYTNGLLTSYSDAEGNTTTYEYDTCNRLNKVVSPEKVVLYAITYDKSDRVTSKTEKGSTYTYSYKDKERTITCTEPNGKKTTFQYTKDYRIESETDQDGTVTYAYNEKEKENESDTVKAQAIESSESKSDKEEKTQKAKKQSVDPSILELKTYNMNICTGDTKNNTLYPQFHITNTSDADIDLADLTIRYYFTVDGERKLNFFCDFAAIQDTNVIKSNVKGKFLKLNNPVDGADCDMEVSFESGAGKLAPGSYVDIHTRIGKDNWSEFKPGDDYSQNTATSLNVFDQVDVFYQGNLVWGKGEISGEGTDLTSPPDEDNNHDNGQHHEQPNNQNNNQNNNSNYEEKIKPKGTNNLKLQMYNTGNKEGKANTIHPMMRLVNLGENMVKLSNVTIRYYYTADDEKEQKFWCDWSNAGQNNVTGTFKKLEETKEGADTYLEVGFTEDAGYIDIGSSTEIQVRIAKDDWSNYDLTNDHSINPADQYEDWKKVDVFVDGVKVWGEDLEPKQEEDLEAEQMDYADSTYTPVSAKMFNRDLVSRCNEIAPRFRVYNTSEDAIKLSDLRLNYFYTTDGPEDQIFEVDWAGIGSRFGSTINKNDVACTFTDVNDTNLATKCVADVTFTRDDLFIQPGEYLELQIRIHRPTWTKYVQENDFSFNPDSKDYEEWKQIAVYVGDRWVWGSIPLSYTEIIDPDPHEDEEEDTTYPEESKESYATIKDKEGNTTEYTYDTNGNITTIIDAEGNKTTNHYNERGQITSIKDALGNTTIYDYDSKGNLTSVKDALGNTTKYTYNTKGFLTKTIRADGSTEVRTYDEKGNIESVTDGNGNAVTYAYDALNQIKQYTDANGGITKYTYSLNGNVTKVTDALGHAIKTSYNKDGQVTKETDKNGNSTTYGYDRTTGYQTQIINAMSGKQLYEYDKMGNVTKVTAEDGGITSYTYDLNGRVLSETDAIDGKITYTYDKNGNTINEVDELGNKTTYTYDKLGQVLTESDSKSTNSYKYDALGRTLEETNPNGGVTKYEYDKLGNVVKTTNVLGNVIKNTYNKVGQLVSTSETSGKKATYEYDKEGKKTKETDSLGNITQYAYDKNGNLKKETDANGHSTTYTYDKENQVKTIKDALGHTTSYTYDANGNTLSETDALGYTTSYTYDALGNQTSTTNALGKTTKSVYDSKGLLTRETDAKGNVTSYAYDKNDNIIKKTDALGASTSYTYDKAGQVLEETDALGYKTSYTYDKKGNILQKTDPKGNHMDYEYDKADNLTKVTDALGHVVTYEYDDQGNLTKQTRVGSSSDKDQITAYEYDKSGNLVKQTDPNGDCIKYLYNSEGKITKETSKDGTIKKYSYDKVGNQKKITYSDDRSVSYTYTKSNQVKTMTDWNGTTTYEYDENDQVTKGTDAFGNTTSYDYTKLGQKKAIIYPTSKRVAYTYDDNGNITKFTDTKNGVTKFTYDGNDQKKTKQLPNGATSSYTYNKNGWLTKRVEAGSASANQTYTYEYDKNGNRTKESKVGSGSTENTSYTYDELNQLTKVTDKNGTRTYAFDEFNNRSKKQENGKDAIEYTYNKLNELKKSTQGSKETKYEYDKRGNLTKVEEDGETTKQYTFDSTNKMSKAAVKKAGKTVTSKYTYDGRGNRINAKVDTNGSVTSNTSYISDTESAYEDIIMAKDSVSGKTSTFTYADELISVDSDGKISYYRTNDQHSVTDLLDDSGRIDTTIEYDEYGNAKNPEKVTTDGNIFAYTGHVYDESTGLYYAKARYYDGECGRFVSEDSFKGEKNNLISLNQYIYGSNNSLKYTDPSGNMNYITQIDDFIGGVIRGIGSWLWDTIKAPLTMIKLIKQLVCGEISIKEAIKQGLNSLVCDIKYVKNHLGQFKPWKKVSNKKINELGYHTGRVVCLVVSAILAGKGIASKFKNSKLGQKLINKARNNTSKVNLTRKTYCGTGKYIKASLHERLTKTKEYVTNLHANPLDEFSNPKIGPCESAVSKYVKEINTTGKLSQPIEVQKLASGGYEIINGHHRWLAAKKVGLKKVPIKIKNYRN